MKDFDAIIIGTGQAGPSLAAWSAMRTRQSPSWTGLDLVADAALSTLPSQQSLLDCGIRSLRS